MEATSTKINETSIKINKPNKVEEEPNKKIRQHTLPTKTIKPIYTKKEIINEEEKKAPLTSEEYIDLLCPDKEKQKKLPSALQNITKEEFEKILIMPLKKIPTKYLSEELCCNMVLRWPRELLSIPNSLLTNRIKLTATSKNSEYFRTIDKKEITEQMILDAIVKGSIHWGHIEERLRTKELYIKVLNISGRNLINIKDSDRDEEVCTAAIHSSGEGPELHWIPKKILTKEMFVDCILKNPKTIEACVKDTDYKEILMDTETHKIIKERKGSFEAFLKHCIKKNPESIFIIPEKLIDKECRKEALKAIPIKIKTHFIGSKEWKEQQHWKIEEWLNAKQIHWNQITEEIKRTQESKLDYYPLLARNDSPLFEYTVFFHEERLIEELKNTYIHIETKTFKDILHIKRENEKKGAPNIESIPEMTVEAEHIMITGKKFGGRTLKNKENYFKFWKEKEPFSNFEIESETVTYLNKHKKEIGIKSEIPQSQSIRKIKKSKNLDVLIQIFNDKPKIIFDEKNKMEYYIIYYYKASENYSKYAHQPNTDSEEKYIEAHEGLLKAIHDIGRLARHGILYTSTLPAFHNIDRDREWMLMGQMFTYMKCPGTLRSWSTQATEYPDLGYSGLRDFGDFSIIGLTTDYINRDKVRCKKNIDWLAGQKMSLYNAIGESTIAVILLYARLHKNYDESYHHSNSEAIKQLSNYIDKTINELLKGYLIDENNSVRKFLNIDDHTYEEWLKISSERILYWTENQDIEKDCYTRDLIETGKCNPKIYPISKEDGYTRIKISAQNGFVSNEGEPDLAGTNKVFPLMNLAEGIAYICRQIETKVKETK